MQKRTNPRLEELKKKADDLRANRKGKRGRIPKELWEMAIDVAALESVSAAAKATGFGHDKLKARLMKRKSDVQQKQAFIELPEPSRRSELRVEFINGHGGKMRLEVPVEGDVLSQVMKSFWSSGR